MKQKTAAKKVEGDAKGQFVRSRHGANNDGVASAEPRVITGDEDATFDADRAARYRKPGKKTERPFSPQTRD